jgi:hypothetical protein
MRSDRSGRLQATTPFPDFNILVTAEQKRDVQSFEPVHRNGGAREAP